jgi:hypothetical protein
MTMPEWLAQCEARNRDAGGRCQRMTANTNHLCDHHQDWVPPRIPDWMKP